MYKTVGCYTSPHQVDVRERILINNKKVSKTLFSRHVRKLHNTILAQIKLNNTPRAPGYPGFLVLLALNIFLEEKVDVVILETGVGGERDSTNVFLSPVATGITTIALDHTDTLGSTIQDIAWHKSGIFKPNVPACTTTQNESVMQVLIQRALDIHVAGKLQVVTDCLIIKHNVAVVPDLPYQRLNASLAISLADTYFKSCDPSFTMTDDIAQGLQDAKLLGRCQIINKNQVSWFVSLAHSVKSLQETIIWFSKAVPTQ